MTVEARPAPPPLPVVGEAKPAVADVAPSATESSGKSSGETPAEEGAGEVAAAEAPAAPGAPAEPTPDAAAESPVVGDERPGDEGVTGAS